MASPTKYDKRRPDNIDDDCDKSEECDKKYVLQVWFWRGLAIALISIVASSFFIGQWVYAIESQTKENTQNIKELKTVSRDIDTVKQMLRLMSKD